MNVSLGEALRLYLVTDRSLSLGRTEEDVVRAAAAGGITAVQLRGKDMTSRELYETGLKLRRLSSDLGLLLIINDRLDIALAVGADGVHLGQEDLPIHVARRLAPRLLLGATVGSVEEAFKAESEGADYLGTSAVFKTSTKAYQRDPLGLSGLRRICQASKIPVVAIGGIKASNAAQVMREGVVGVAVVSGIVSAADVMGAARGIRQEIEGVHEC